MIDSGFNIYINKNSININDRAFTYGDGLFETILVKNKQIIYLNDHIKRLRKGCDVLSIKRPSKNMIDLNSKKAIGDTKNGILKIILSRGSTSHGYQFQKNLKPNIYFNKYIFKKNILNRKKDIKMKIAKYQTYGNANLSKIKHMNRIDQCLVARELLYLKNTDDLILSYHGNLIEAISSNLFFVKKLKDTYIFETPDINDFGVEGIMRDKIIKFIKKSSFKIYVKNIKVRDLSKYHSAFKINSISGIKFINAIENNKFSIDKMLYNVLNEFVY